MRESIGPALTPDEWARAGSASTVVASDGGVYFGERKPGRMGVEALRVDVASERHALAALALHGQPFGFTNDDARALNDAIVYLHNHHYDASKIASIARRIAALLPPEE